MGEQLGWYVAIRDMRRREFRAFVPLDLAPDKATAVKFARKEHRRSGGHAGPVLSVTSVVEDKEATA